MQSVPNSHSTLCFRDSPRGLAEGKQGRAKPGLASRRRLDSLSGWFSAQMKTIFILISSGDFEGLAEFGDEFVEVQPKGAYLKP